LVESVVSDNGSVPRGRRPGSGGHPRDEVVGDGVAAALEVTLGSLDLRHEAAAHVAAMRVVAARLDGTYDSDTLSKLASTFMRQCVELRQWVAPPPIEEDPWDALSRSLNKDVAGDD
jgi:hypothetical protein